MRPADTVMMVIVVVLWGANFIAIRESVIQAPPIFVLALRFMLQALILIPFISLSAKQIKLLLPHAIIMGIGHFGLIFVGIAGLDASVSAIVMQLNTPLLVVFAWWFLGEKFGWKRALGISIAFFGVMILSGNTETIKEWHSIVILTLSSACWAYGNIQIKRLGKISPFLIMIWVSLVSIPGLLVLSAIIESGQLLVITEVDAYFWFSLAYMSIGSTICGYGIWYYLVSKYSISRIAHYNMLVPVVAVVLGVCLLGEELSIGRILGGILTLLGVSIVQFRIHTLKNEK